MGHSRDPLSVHYDRSARRLLLAAIRARALAAVMFVHSPGPQFRDLDQGARWRLTLNERAFTRSVFYQVMKVPPRQWSAEISPITPPSSTSCLPPRLRSAR